MVNLQKISLILPSLALLAGCGSSPMTTPAPSVQPPSDRRAYSVIPDDFHGIYFEEGAPGPNDPLMPALSRTLGNSEAALRHDLEQIAVVPADERLRVLGYTDDRECKASECQRLSLRRAERFQAWLIENGVPANRLDAPKGFGAARPIGDNATASGRAKNRRAHIAHESESRD